jgi:hypothetical protein
LEKIREDLVRNTAHEMVAGSCIISLISFGSSPSSEVSGC